MDNTELVAKVLELETKVNTLLEENRKLKEGGGISLKTAVEDGNGNQSFLATLLEHAQNASSAGDRSDTLCIRVGSSDRGKVIDALGKIGWINLVVGTDSVSGEKVAVSGHLR